MLGSAAGVRGAPVLHPVHWWAPFPQAACPRERLAHVPFQSQEGFKAVTGPKVSEHFRSVKLVGSLCLSLRGACALGLGMAGSRPHSLTGCRAASDSPRCKATLSAEIQPSPLRRSGGLRGNETKAQRGRGGSSPQFRGGLRVGPGGRTQLPRVLSSEMSTNPGKEPAV